MASVLHATCVLYIIEGLHVSILRVYTQPEYIVPSIGYTATVLYIYDVPLSAICITKGGISRPFVAAEYREVGDIVLCNLIALQKIIRISSPSLAMAYGASKCICVM